VMASLMAWRRGNLRHLAVVGLLLAAALSSFGILVFGRHKNEAFFSTFVCLAAFSGFHSIRLMDGYLNRQWGQRFLVCVSIAIIYAVSFNLAKPRAGSLSENLRFGSWNAAIADVIAGQLTAVQTGGGEARRSVFVTVAGPVNSHTVKWELIKRGRDVDAIDLHRAGEMSAFLDAALVADFVVLPASESTEFFQGFPSAGLQTDLAVRLLGDGQFSVIDLPAPLHVNDQRYVLLRNNGRLQRTSSVLHITHANAVEGIKQEEGPYPQWGLPRVRWQNDPVARICLYEPGDYAVRLVFRPNGTGLVKITSQLHEHLAQSSVTPLIDVDMAFNFESKVGSTCFLVEALMSQQIASNEYLLYKMIEVRKR
jgi:hypothetical protein